MGQENNKQLTIDDIKKIIKDIEEEERKNFGFNGKIRNLTAVEYYKDSFKNKNLTLVKKISSLTVPLTASGICNFKNSSIVIFVDSYKKIIVPNKKTLNFIETCYHEIRHTIQPSLEDYSFDKFACDIDHLIASFNYNTYNNKHDSFYFEIDANLYGIYKAKEYLINKLPDVYENIIIQKHLEMYCNIYFNALILYDLSNSIEEASFLLKKHNFSKEEKDEISPILNIFFNEDNSFKSIKEIINNNNFKNIDPRISSSFFSSKVFLDSIDLNSLDYYELDILREVLESKNNMYMFQQEIVDTELKNNKERLQQSLNVKKNIINKIKTLHSYLYLIKEFKKIQAKSYRGHELHKKKIPEYLDKTNSLLSSKKNNGFVIIDIFYIISFIISIGVIGYIILF